MSTELIHLAYFSCATISFPDPLLKELIKRANLKNQEMDITGILLFEDGKFLQCIEGEASDIDALYGSIVKDRRHSNIIRLLYEPIEMRGFPDWQMALRQLPEGFLDTELPNCNTFLQEAGEDSSISLPDFVPDQIRALLTQFRRKGFFHQRFG